MKSEPIMTFKVYADSQEVSNLECAYGAVTMIPFRATVESELFTQFIHTGTGSPPYLNNQ